MYVGAAKVLTGAFQTPLKASIRPLSDNCMLLDLSSGYALCSGGGPPEIERQWWSQDWRSTEWSLVNRVEKTARG